MSIVKPRGRFSADEIIDRKRKHLEPAELKKVFDVLQRDPFWNGYFRTQYQFGCRVSEVAIILKEDVSFEKRMIVIRRLKKRQLPSKLVEVDGKKKRMADKTATRGTGFDEHVYGLPKTLVDILAKAAQQAPSANPWFFGVGDKPVKGKVKTSGNKDVDRMALIRRLDAPEGMHWASVSRGTADDKFRQAAIEAGVPRRLAHTHVLRHTRATLMLAAVEEKDMAARMEQIRFLLGHSNINTTRGYMGVAKSLRARMEAGVGDDALGDLGEE